MFVKLMSFNIMNTIGFFSGMFSHMFAEKVKFCCNFTSVTDILKLTFHLFRLASRVMWRLGCMDSSVYLHKLWGLEA